MTTQPIVMDGTRLAAQRAPVHAARAAQVTEGRGRAPEVLLVAFADGSATAPHIAGKQSACAAVGVTASALILAPGTKSTAAADQLRRLINDSEPDAVFLQFPFPTGIDESVLVEAMPESLDVDVMSAHRIAQYLTGGSPFPPVTVTAALQLIEGYAIDIQALRGVVVGPVHPFTLMFREALSRRGANMEPLIAVDAPDLKVHVRDAQLVVVAAAQPGILRSSDLTAGTVAIDAGYYNSGGAGDIDVTSGITHLHSFAPVPGGIGPMTVSALVERVIEFASMGRGSASTGHATARSHQT